MAACPLLGMAYLLSGAVLASQTHLARGWLVGVAAWGMDGTQLDEETH